MRPKKPRVTIEGDNAQQIMARLGWMIGFDQKHVIWVFGILPGTPAAKAWGVSVPKLTWVIAEFDGTIVKTEVALESELTEWYQEILAA